MGLVEIMKHVRLWLGLCRQGCLQLSGTRMNPNCQLTISGIPPSCHHIPWLVIFLSFLAIFCQCWIAVNLLLLAVLAAFRLRYIFCFSPFFANFG